MAAPGPVPVPSEVAPAAWAPGRSSEDATAEPTTGVFGLSAGGSCGAAGVPVGAVVAVAMLLLVVELVASGRLVVVVGAVVAVVDDVVAAAVIGVIRVVVVVGADGSTTTISPCMPRPWWTRQK
jgi:hypothetical protein